VASFTYRRTFTIEWGHCDPAGIVFNARFFEFFDANTWMLFETALGVAKSELSSAFKIAGMPLVGAKARFMQPAKFNDTVELVSNVSEFRRSSFDIKHQLFNGGALTIDGQETRVWAAMDTGDVPQLKAKLIPADVISRFNTP
jgi:4-hydroxybenzoyl-CoA thioesterase